MVSRLFSQDFFWQTSLFSFFDNLEFADSRVKIPQTMAGVMIAPEVGFKWDSVHRIGGGVNLIHEFGSTDVIDKVYPTAYYEYSGGPFRFIMGAFPRSRALESYPRVFFQDSLSYYRPNINGIFLEFHPSGGYVNAWLDWTGRQSETVREAFFTGISGRYNYRNLYVRNYSYMFHYASKKDPFVHEALHDNMLFLTSLGVDLSGRMFFTCLDINAGWVLGLERARVGDSNWISTNGLLAETRVEYKFAGLFNTFYTGGGMMNFYEDHNSDLYWGDPVYRAKVYDRLDIYLRLLRKQRIDLRLTWSLHFLEENVYNEQMLKVRIDINSPRYTSGGQRVNTINNRMQFD
jgi:hypothetical protein